MLSLALSIMGRATDKGLVLLVQQTSQYLSLNLLVAGAMIGSNSRPLFTSPQSLGITYCTCSNMVSTMCHTSVRLRKPTQKALGGSGLPVSALRHDQQGTPAAKCPEKGGASASVQVKGRSTRT